MGPGNCIPPAASNSLNVTSYQTRSLTNSPHLCSQTEGVSSSMDSWTAPQWWRLHRSDRGRDPTIQLRGILSIEDARTVSDLVTLGTDVTVERTGEERTTSGILSTLHTPQTGGQDLSQTLELLLGAPHFLLKYFGGFSDSVIVLTNG